MFSLSLTKGQSLLSIEICLPPWIKNDVQFKEAKGLIIWTSKYLFHLLLDISKPSAGQSGFYKNSAVTIDVKTRTKLQIATFWEIYLYIYIYIYPMSRIANIYLHISAVGKEPVGELPTHHINIYYIYIYICLI